MQIFHSKHKLVVNKFLQTHTHTYSIVWIFARMGGIKCVAANSHTHTHTQAEKECGTDVGVKCHGRHYWTHIS